jgi:hypothetical protein
VGVPRRLRRIPFVTASAREASAASRDGFGEGHLRESQSDKETFVRTATMRLQQQQLAIRAKLDRAYDDRLSSRIPEDLWTSKSAELEAELRRVRAEMAHHERASHDYERTGLQILELAQTAYSLYVAQNPLEQA